VAQRDAWQNLDCVPKHETMIEPSLRLRRAIHLGSLSLVKRIVPKETAEHPDLLYNHDEDGNTSLHHAAQLGLPDIAVSCSSTAARKIIS
jgi:hypothetical protein